MGSRRRVSGTDPFVDPSEDLAPRPRAGPPRPASTGPPTEESLSTWQPRSEILGPDARERMLPRLDTSPTRVKVTLWARRGRNVVIEKSFGAPRITKDGVIPSPRRSGARGQRFENQWAPRWCAKVASEDDTTRRRRHDDCDRSLPQFDRQGKAPRPWPRG